MFSKMLEEKSNSMESAVTPEKVLGFLGEILSMSNSSEELSMKYNPEVLDGCIYCFENEPSLCTDMGKSGKCETVLAEPMDGMEKPLAFPVKCLSKCFGDRLMFCENCKVAFPAEPNSTCKHCGKTLTPFIGKVPLKKIRYHNVDYDKEKYAYTHDPSYADWGGFERYERAFLETGGSLYAVDFEIKRGCEYCIDKYGECKDCHDYYLDSEKYVEFDVGDKVYIEEVPYPCATTTGVGKSLCKHCGIVIENVQERCPICFGNTHPISRLKQTVTNRKKG